MLIKGTGGYHLACDATNHAAVTRLREIKVRDVKPFALMARDLEVIKRYVTVSPEEEKLIRSSEAPIVLLPKPIEGPSGERKEFGVPGGARPLDLIPMSDDIAPGCNTLGFMLPNTAMHHLILKRMNRPIVLTSANVADHPQFIDDQAVVDQFTGEVEFIPHLIDDASGVGVQLNLADLNSDGRLDVLSASKLGTFIFLNQM